MTSPSPLTGQLAPEEDAAACRSVVASVYDAIDSGQATRAIPCYADDAVLESGRGSAHGIGEIIALLSARELDRERITRHVLSDVEVTPSGTPGVLRLTATLAIYAPAGSQPEHPEHISDLTMHLRHSRAGWTILRHVSARRD